MLITQAKGVQQKYWEKLRKLSRKDTNLARWEDLVQHGDTNCALDTGKELRKGFQALSEQEAENRIKYAYFNILLYTNVYIYIYNT